MRDKEKFTIGEIRNYILSQDSLSEALYNLSPERIYDTNMSARYNKENEEAVEFFGGDGNENIDK